MNTCHCCPWCDQPHDCSPDCNRPDCPACEDRGEVDTGRTEADTGYVRHALWGRAAVEVRAA